MMGWRGQQGLQYESSPDRAFAAVMRCGTTSRAAEALGITQPAVSRSVAELERSVGFPLFARIRHRLVATPEGRMLYDEVAVTFQGLDTIRATPPDSRSWFWREFHGVRGALRDSESCCHLQEETPERSHYTADPSNARCKELIASGAFDVGLPHT